MFKELFTFEDLQEASGAMFGFSQVTMLKDFGPLKSGQRVGGIWFLFEKSVVEIYNNEGTEKLLEFPFRLTA